MPDRLGFVGGAPKLRVSNWLLTMQVLFCILQLAALEIAALIRDALCKTGVMQRKDWLWSFSAVGVLSSPVPSTQNPNPAIRWEIYTSMLSSTIAGWQEGLSPNMKESDPDETATPAARLSGWWRSSGWTQAIGLPGGCPVLWPQDCRPPRGVLAAGTGRSLTKVSPPIRYSGLLSCTGC